MNDKELDRLFRQKLEPLEVTPSDRAWQQLESQLQHKKQKKGWFFLSGVAAAILLLLGIWGAFDYSRQLTPVEQMANSQTEESHKAVPLAVEQETPQPESTEAETARPSALAAEEASQSAVVSEIAAASKQPEKEAAPVQKREQQQTAALAAAEKPQPLEEEAELAIASVESKPIEAHALAANVPQPIIEEPLNLREEVVISYRADEEAVAIADISQGIEAPAKEKELSARKILGFFKKVSNSSGAGLAELREAKNELLSLNRLSSPE